MGLLLTIEAAARLGGARRCSKLPQHVLQDAAVAEVLALLWSIDAHARRKADRIRTRHCCTDIHRAGLAAVQPGNVENLATRQSQ